MPRSKRSQEGYLLVDHRASPGIPSALVQTGHFLDAPAGKVAECPTYTCSHCHRVVVMNPLRTRSREWCGSCDHYICDACGAAKKAGAACRTLNQLFDQLQEGMTHG